MAKPQKPIKHFHRLRTWDYARGCTLFITITTAPRRQVFGRVVDAKMILGELGREALAALGRCFNTEWLRLYDCVVMPDHVHFLVYLKPGLEQQAAIRLLNTAVGGYKSWVNHCAWKFGVTGALWQEGFHDWVCVSREMIDAVKRYIAYNPLKWELRNNRHLLRLYEPIVSERLPPGDYWRGVGALGVLDESRQFVSLRVSRRCAAGDIAALITRLQAAAAHLVVVSGFVSGGERAVMAALLDNPAARLLKVNPDAMPHDYQPGVALMPAIQEGRLAIIAAGNAPEELSRPACLDVNAKIIEIADRAAYVLPGEVKWLK